MGEGEYLLHVCYYKKAVANGMGASFPDTGFWVNGGDGTMALADVIRTHGLFGVQARIGVACAVQDGGTVGELGMASNWRVMGSIWG